MQINHSVQGYGVNRAHKCHTFDFNIGRASGFIALGYREGAWGFRRNHFRTGFGFKLPGIFGRVWLSEGSKS